MSLRRIIHVTAAHHLVLPIPKSLRAGIVNFFVFFIFCAPPAHTGLGNAAKITNFFVFEVGGMGPVPSDSSSRVDPQPSSPAVHLGLQAMPLTSRLCNRPANHISGACIPGSTGDEAQKKVARSRKIGQIPQLHLQDFWDWLYLQ